VLHLAKRTRKDSVKRAKRLAVASALILLLTFIFKEVLKEHLKELQDSLQSAEALNRTETGQSALSVENLTLQQEIEELRQGAKDGLKADQRDYSEMIGRDILTGQQMRAHLGASFDSVSRLVDKLPSGAGDLRQQRDELRTEVDGVDKGAADTLKPSSRRDLSRAVEVKVTIARLTGEEIPVALLGDLALTRARSVQEAAERLYRICGWASYVLYVTGVALALYATLSGLKIAKSDE